MNSPSSRSRMMLEAAQARHSLNSLPNIHVQMSTSIGDARHSLGPAAVKKDKGIIPLNNDKNDEPSEHAMQPPTMPMSPNVGRSILKRVSTGASAKKVSFSRANEVCAYDKHPRVSTAKSLFPPVMVRSQDTSNDRMDDSDAQNVAKTTEEANSLLCAVNRLSSETATSTAETCVGQAADEQDKTAHLVNTSDTPKESAEEKSLNVTFVDDEKIVTAIERTELTSTIAPVNIVEMLKSAQSDQLVDVLDLIASRDFIETLSSDVRGAFFSKCLTTMSSYQCNH